MGFFDSTINAFSQDQTNRSNRRMVRETNRQNRAMWQEEFDYNKALQQQTWAREDTAMSRAVEDATKAGLSPLAVAGSGGFGSGTVVPAPTSPTMEAAQYRAPAFNFDSSIDVYMKNKELELRGKELGVKVSEGAANREVLRQNVLDSLSNSLEIAELKRNQEESQFSRSQFENVRQFTESLGFQLRAQGHTESIDNQRFLLEKHKALMSQVSGATGGIGSAYKVYKNREEYEGALVVWSNAFANEVKSNLSFPDSESTSSSKSDNSSGGASILGFGGNLGSGSSDSSGESRDYSSRNRLRLASWLTKNPMPVYFP